MFSAVSLNVMAPPYARGSISKKADVEVGPSVEDDPAVEDRGWAERSRRIVSYILELGPDVVFLQEMPLGEVGNDIWARMWETYDHYAHIPHAKRTSKIGNVTWWRKSKIYPTFTSWTSSSVIVTLRNDHGAQVTTANVHLKAGYRTHLATRVNQMRSIVAAVGKSSSVVIVGDFNDDLSGGASSGAALVFLSLSGEADHASVDSMLSSGGYRTTRFGATFTDRSGSGREFDLVASRGVIVESMGTRPDVGSDHLPIHFSVSTSAE